MRAKGRPGRAARVALLVAGVGVLRGPAHAGEPAPAAATPEDQAQSLADQAAAAYRAGDFPQALQLSQRAYGLRAEPTLLYNQARIYEKMGQAPAALEYYRRFLVAEGGDPKLRAKAEERVTALSQAPSPAQRGGSPGLVGSVAAVKPKAPPPGQKLIIAGAVLAGLGVLGIGAGIGLYAAALSPYGDFQSAQDVYQKRAAMDRIAPLSAGSVAGYAVGGVLVAGGATLIGLGVRERLHRKAGPEARPSRVALLPDLSPSGAALWLVGGF